MYERPGSGSWQLYARLGPGPDSFMYVASCLWDTCNEDYDVTLGTCHKTMIWLLVWQG